MKPETLLFTAVGLGPLAWALSVGANYAIAPIACGGNGKTALYLISSAALLLAIAGGVISFTRYHLRERGTNVERHVPDSRRNAMALAGLGISCLCIFLILAQAIPNLMMAGCE